ncbi:invasion associated locus B family protein [Rhodosalinus sp.]|uniref:invasion associated locus B family protein n=1 Tax=Rhodosalinus sp. TaxID=2047741 RepID=UPI00397A0083
MTSRMVPGLAGVLLLMAGSVATAQEAESTNRVAAETDWSVFIEDNPKECWAVTQPKETENTRDGRVVAVRRGETLLFTFFRPDEDVAGQVTFTGGYPFSTEEPITLVIGDSEFRLYTQPDDSDTPVNEQEWAWAASPEEDAKIAAAMRRGSDAVVTAQSTRGTQTQDTFSLMGYTSAVEEAQRRCEE